MEQWQERVIEEHAKLCERKRVIEEHVELCERTVKLAGFIRGPESHKLTLNEYRLVTQQLNAMMLYIDALDARIKCFQKDAPE